MIVLNMSVSQENWKEQFGVVSGTILVAGVGLLKLWPYVATFQTGRIIHAWSTELPGEVPNPSFVWFQLLTLFLAIGMSSALLSTVHIVYRVLWLGIPPLIVRSRVKRSMQKWLSRRATRLYVGVLFLWFFFALGVGFCFAVGLCTGFELWLRAFFSSKSAWLRFVSIIPLIIILAAFAFFLFKRLPNVSEKGLRDLTRQLKSFWLAFATAMASWAIALEMCYTVELAADKRVISRSKQEGAEMTFRLGGATADQKKAITELRSEGGLVVKELVPLPWGEGQYVAYLKSSEFHEGLYRGILIYPRPTLSFTYPFFHQSIERSVSILVVQ